MLYILLNDSSIKIFALAGATIVVEKQMDYSKAVKWARSTFGDFLEDVGWQWSFSWQNWWNWEIIFSKKEITRHIQFPLVVVVCDKNKR